MNSPRRSRLRCRSRKSRFTGSTFVPDSYDHIAHNEGDAFDKIRMLAPISVGTRKRTSNRMNRTQIIGTGFFQAWCA